MNDNELKTLFKDSSPELSDNFADLLMRKIEKRNKPAMAFDFKYIKYINYLITSAILITLIVSYIFKPQENSYLDNIITDSFTKFNNIFTSIFANSQTTNILLAVTAILAITYFSDKIIGQLFNKKKIHK